MGAEFWAGIAGNATAYAILAGIIWWRLNQIQNSVDAIAERQLSNAAHFAEEIADVRNALREHEIDREIHPEAERVRILERRAEA